eukprot:TRINITY_DN2908_c0_g1_i3.p1 TRINITY_DN2908_c0_g1~~TRINITY_DN2908_c0_g1_i3.p1  ORF type:complete len:593 (+),score=121.91 TRINITY_DN2908_c0_g1_i3:85-1863(+)
MVETPAIGENLEAFRESCNVVPEDLYAEGEQVEYFSATNGNQYQTARIIKIHSNGGFIKTVDLDIKNNASIGKVRKQSGHVRHYEEGDSQRAVDRALDDVLQSKAFGREVPSPTHDVNAALGFKRTSDGYSPSSCSASALVLRHREAENQASSSSPGKADSRFEPGDTVFYKSKTLGQTLQTEVVRVKEHGYDLGCKNNAQKSNVFATLEEAEGVLEDQQCMQQPEQLLAEMPIQLPMEQRSASDLKPSTAALAERSLVHLPLQAAGVVPATSSPSARLAHVTPALAQASHRGVVLKTVAGGEGSPKASSISAYISSVPSAATAASSSAAKPPALRGPSLQFGPGPFAPARPELLRQLAVQLCLGEPSAWRVEEMKGHRGGMNQGVWFLTGRPGQEFVLKLVRCHRIASNVLTDAENFAKMQRDHPSIARDPVLSFPVKVFNCIGEEGHCHDLIVMKKVAGERLSEYICRKYYAKQVPFLLQVCEQIGKVLLDFHCRYANKQHGDFQPSNIFYDEATGAVTFIDVGGFGVPTMESDSDHFLRAVNMMANTYGPTLHSEISRAFERGYPKNAARSPPPVSVAMTYRPTSVVVR